MLYQGLATTAELSSTFDHPWQIADQERAFAACCAYVPSRESVSSVCGPWLATQTCSVADLGTGRKVTGNEVTTLLLNQALDYFQKAPLSITSSLSTFLHDVDSGVVVESRTIMRVFSRFTDFFAFKVAQ